jgi:pyrimidine-nucleoside phosphorylase
MVQIALDTDILKANKLVDDSLKSGRAYEKFLEIIKYQGGNLSLLRVSKNTKDILAKKEGHIVNMDAYKFGKLSLDLGGGRETKEDKIDSSVGIVLKKKIGDAVKVGDVLATLYLKEDEENTSIGNDLEDYYTYEDKLELL